jgi:hypothetical protein
MVTLFLALVGSEVLVGEAGDQEQKSSGHGDGDEFDDDHFCSMNNYAEIERPAYMTETHSQVTPSTLQTDYMTRSTSSGIIA